MIPAKEGACLFWGAVQLQSEHYVAKLKALVLILTQAGYVTCCVFISLQRVNDDNFNLTDFKIL